MSTVEERPLPTAHLSSLSARTAELAQVREAVRLGPGEAATAAQHAKGKLTARERLALLFDEGVYTEVEGMRRHRA
ncbi:methylmalonyl-CoA carboxyltransferase, partial [Streptomyces sp. NPDC006658]